MRPITYILGVVAGFFTFGGIGLIIKGYMVEGGITLVIGLLCLIQFIRFLKEDYLMGKNQNYVWYAGYGSNLSKQRFECYIKGGERPKYAVEDCEECKGCTDKNLPGKDDNHSYIIKHKLYFALPSRTGTKNWGPGGVAFIHPNEDKDKNHWTKGRIWKITKDQFDEIRPQEGSKWYDYPLNLGKRDGIPIITLTNELVRELFPELLVKIP